MDFVYFREMKIRCLLLNVLVLLHVVAKAQSTAASAILQDIKKLQVLGSVLYIAAHPDDENTRLITYLANDRLYRTGYLSLTRGDGGQNLIGDEQGVDLGLIRTQELLAARRIDGGEQFFTRAYDFGYSKNPEETFTKWKKEKILADVVWVIRQFQPDVIITRFPTTGEGGHGHHTASAILANEAFQAAADPNQFKEQLKWVKPWKAQRILWNTFNFGGNNTTDPSQFKINVGGYNALLGKSYGEIAALSRSQHKSQGFGSAASRGDSYDYFKTTGGTDPKTDLMDGVDISWNRLGSDGKVFQNAIAEIEKNFDLTAPQKSVPALVALYKMLNTSKKSYWINLKKNEVQQLIALCSGLYIDAYSNQPYAVQTADLNISFVVNNRLGVAASLKKISLDDWSHEANETLPVNKNITLDHKLSVGFNKPITQPYWLKEKMEEGMFDVTDQTKIGIPDIEPAYSAQFIIDIWGQEFKFYQPVQYRYTDPVKGEVYQPLIVIPPATLSANPNLIIFTESHRTRIVQTQLHAYTKLEGSIGAGLTSVDYVGLQKDPTTILNGGHKVYNFEVAEKHAPEEVYTVTPYAFSKVGKDSINYNVALKTIQYDHIPTVRYFYTDFIASLNIDLKIVGKKIGYIPGAGDKVAQVLERMGYEVVLLDKATIAVQNLNSFDAIITGVRAYNTNDWLNEYYDALMSYVKSGGHLIVQYNTNNNLGGVKSKIGPYDFNITRNRITDENAKVTLKDPTHKVFNFPNKITSKDFENWVQERSIYHAGNWGSEFTPLLSMSDPGERADDGSLITAKYGKGYFTYTGLVFFRELPAAVPGAIRLMANLIALGKDE